MQIRNIRQLREALSEGHREFQIVPKDGSCESKTIRPLTQGLFRVTNGFDGSVQEIAESGLYMENSIGAAMKDGILECAMKESAIPNDLDTMLNGVPKADHYFMKMCLCNDEESSDEQLREHFVSQGVLPEHADRYIAHRVQYLNEFFIKDDGIPRFPLESEADQKELMNLPERTF